VALALDENRALAAHALRIRERILEIVFRSGSGHVGGALSQTDLLVALYYKYLKIDPARPTDEKRDRFVLSKGHGGLGLAAILADRGFFPVAELDSFGRSGAALGMHMDRMRVAGVEASTGSLGHGLGIAVGLALGARVQKCSWRTFCLLSDGECYEGSVWEAALAAPALRLGNLIALVDRNRMTMDGATEALVPLEPLQKKWEAFGWRASTCDGHDFDSICAALDSALRETDDRPSLILCETVKGKGVDFMEGEARWHYGGLDAAMYERAQASLRRSTR
jgi:transketolase